MAADSTHHVGLLVADIERSARFYIEAFDGHWLLRPVTLDGKAGETIMNGPPGTAFKICLIGLPEGRIGLHQFVGDVVPEWVSPPRIAAVPHVGIQVDDTDATLVRVEQAGGRRIWDEVMQWGEARVVFVADPDGNALEIINVDFSTVVKGMLELFPDAAP